MRENLTGLKLHVFWVNHADQSVGHADGKSDLLARALVAICMAKKIDFIAEELSEDALEIQGSSHSTCLEVARGARVEHLFCDPDREERQRIGIPTVEQLKTELKIGRAMSTHDEARLISKEREFWPRREAYWLAKIRSLQLTCGIFVCGRDHRESFQNLLRAECVHCESVEWV